MYLELRNLIEQYFISAEKCDVIEETLLKAAGIETQPTKCTFFSSFMKIKGLTTEDKEKFVCFLQACGDPNAYFGNDKDSSHQQGFVFDSKLVRDKIIAYFKDVFLKLPAAVIEEYQRQSVKADSVKAYKRKLLGANNFSVFSSDLEAFLLENYISENKSGVFSKTLLRLAVFIDRNAFINTL